MLLGHYIYIVLLSTLEYYSTKCIIYIYIHIIYIYNIYIYIHIIYIYTHIYI